MLCKPLVNVRIQIRILFQFHFDRSWQRDFDFEFGNRQIDTLCTFFGLYTASPPHHQRSLLAAQFEFVVVVFPLPLRLPFDVSCLVCEFYC